MLRYIIEDTTSPAVPAVQLSGFTFNSPGFNRIDGGAELSAGQTLSAASAAFATERYGVVEETITCNWTGSATQLMDTLENVYQHQLRCATRTTERVQAQLSGGAVWYARLYDISVDVPGSMYDLLALNESQGIRFRIVRGSFMPFLSTDVSTTTSSAVATSNPPYTSALPLACGVRWEDLGVSASGLLTVPSGMALAPNISRYQFTASRNVTNATVAFGTIVGETLTSTATVTASGSNEQAVAELTLSGLALADTGLVAPIIICKEGGNGTAYVARRWALYQESTTSTVETVAWDYRELSSTAQGFTTHVLPAIQIRSTTNLLVLRIEVSKALGGVYTSNIARIYLVNVTDGWGGVQVYQLPTFLPGARASLPPSSTSSFTQPTEFGNTQPRGLGSNTPLPAVATQGMYMPPSSVSAPLATLLLPGQNSEAAFWTVAGSTSAATIKSVILKRTVTALPRP
jgi:hypothetical protein